jgi:hypothetical protein
MPYSAAIPSAHAFADRDSAGTLNGGNGASPPPPLRFRTRVFRIRVVIFIPPLSRFDFGTYGVVRAIAGCRPAVPRDWRGRRGGSLIAIAITRPPPRRCARRWCASTLLRCRVAVDIDDAYRRSPRGAAAGNRHDTPLPLVAEVTASRHHQSVAHPGLLDDLVRCAGILGAANPPVAFAVWLARHRRCRGPPEAVECRIAERIDTTAAR